jgi:hypothetical protein
MALPQKKAGVPGCGGCGPLAQEVHAIAIASAPIGSSQARNFRPYRERLPYLPDIIYLQRLRAAPQSLYLARDFGDSALGREPLAIFCNSASVSEA